MKVLIAYDGSACADHAIDDLLRAGLPPTGAALVVSVADISKNSIEETYEVGIGGKFVSAHLLEATIAHTQNETTRVLNETKEIAIEGGRRFSALFPRWQVKNMTAVGDPAEELLLLARERKPDLLVLGSHGRGTIGRFFLGSVSKKVAEEAACSVRITRRRTEKTVDTPSKIIIGASSLNDAERLVSTVSNRAWNAGTRARLIKADDGVSAGRVSAFYPYAAAMFEQCAETLRSAGLEVSVEVKSGNLKSVLFEQAAEKWDADSIFVVAGEPGDERGLNQTAASLVTDASCAVEIVRQFKAY